MRRGGARTRCEAWLWVTVTAAAPVFTVARHRSAAVARRLLRHKEDQVVSSDRFKSYDWLWAYWRQVCWAHLRRESPAMIDRGGPGEKIGRRLLRSSDRRFEVWHRARDGTLEEGAFQGQVLRLRLRSRCALQDGTKCDCATTARTWPRSLAWRKGSEISCGHRERSRRTMRRPRHAVIWRRICGGTTSESGSRFVERMLTVVATCRQQGRSVLEYLTSCLEADRRGQLSPSLLPVTQPATKVA